MMHQYSTSNATIDEDQHFAIIAMAHSLASGMTLREINDLMENGGSVMVDQNACDVGMESISHINSTLTSVGAQTIEGATETSEYIISQPMLVAFAIMHATGALVFRRKLIDAHKGYTSVNRMLLVSIIANIVMVALSWLN